MLSYEYTKDLLNLQGVIVDKIEQTNDTTKYIEKRKSFKGSIPDK